VGSARIVLQFGLDRDINGAARDVQAAINAARADLPAGLRSNPTWRKFNPAAAPIMVLALTSPTMTRGQIYDAADTVVQQRLSQVGGIGEITLGGSALPAVRVDLNPNALAKYGIGLEDVRAALAAANANSPKGAIEFSGKRFQLYSNDQATSPADYEPLIIAWRNNAPVRLSDIATITEGVENVRTEGLANGKPAVLVILYPQPGANIIDTVDAVKALLPTLRASIPSSINVAVALDRSTTIRASLTDTEVTLLVAVVLVIAVVFLFLRDPRAALIPSVALPVSIIGTFGGMYLLGFSLDNLSLMALTISTGFVVDDAIVVLENTSRHLDAGLSPREAAMRGAREVSFTVLSMSTSLIAVFLPILLMGGIVGRLFREFGLTLSLAIVVSLLVSLTTTPMMCALLLRPRAAKQAGGVLGRVFAGSRATFDYAHARYVSSLTVALRHPLLLIGALGATLALTVFLFVSIPKGLFPTEDTGVLIGSIQADQSISFQAMEQKLASFMAIVRSNRAVENVTGFTGGGSTNSGFVFVTLKPLAER
ncbi:MAG: efflux RND transporter permease subunit, partial [Acetobacteraceae bacterium]